jgi:hypothetical protein
VGEHSTMNEITFEVERDESGWLIASWDAPDGKGGIATQGQDLRELQENVKEAVVCHFEAAAAPRAIRLHSFPQSQSHFAQDPPGGLATGGRKPGRFPKQSLTSDLTLRAQRTQRGMTADGTDIRR